MPTDRDFARVLALRTQTRVLLESDEDEVAEGANELTARALTGLSLLRGPTGDWEWHVATGPRASLSDELGALVGIGLLGVLHTLSHNRFRHCASPVCAGMCIDTSKAGRRRYCMPGLCGNRQNVADYRARHQESEAQPGRRSVTGTR